MIIIFKSAFLSFCWIIYSLEVPKVDNLTAKDVAFFEKLNPKIQEKLNPTPSVEQKRQVLRQEYERLRNQIHADPNLSGAGREKVDIAVAMRVIKEAVESGKSDNLLNRVGGVLSQSDRLKEVSAQYFGVDQDSV